MSDAHPDDPVTTDLPRFAPEVAHGVRRVHHLNCATFCPIGGDLVHEAHRLVCHCLAVETNEGVVLVDTGLGSEAVADRTLATSPLLRAVFRPRFDAAETALAQLEGLGLKGSDVRHIVLTHLDADHAGGLRDFPAATVHVLADEHAAAQAPSSFLERERYRPALWSHDVKWALHEVRGERWYGFECVRDIPGLPPDVLLVPLRGHSRGHCGVAVDVGGHWLLHCGDAYFHKDEVHADPARVPAGLGLFQGLMAVDDAARRRNQARLRELQRGVGEGISVFSAHDPDELDRLREDSALPSSSAL